MLAHVRGADTVRARIEKLHLGRRFPVVLLAGHLVNQPDSAGLVTAVARHLTDDGVALFEWHPPSWFDTVTDREGQLGEVRVSLTGAERDGALLRAVAGYRARGRSWEQPFVARRFSERELRAHLAAAGLGLCDWCTPDRRWFTAARVAQLAPDEYGL